METWFLIVNTIAVALLLKSLLSLLLRRPSPAAKLPPGPYIIPFCGSFLWFRKSFSDLEPILRGLNRKYGPMITLHIGSRPSVFIANRSLAHQALIQNGAVFADRPPSLPTTKFIRSNHHDVNSAFYGPTWRLLRRNLTFEMLHPSRFKSYGGARKRVLDILIQRLISSEPQSAIRVMDHFHYAMFFLLGSMCFDDKLNETQIKEIELVQRRTMLSYGRFNIVNFYPRLTRFIFRKRWNEFFELRRDQEAVLLPLIRARRKAKERKHDHLVPTYVDTLWDIEISEAGEGKRKLSENEMVTLCSEYINAGTDTTATALQWIMANVVKYPRIQERLFDEIREVVADQTAKEVTEEVLGRMPYLKGVILEGLRRHPPGHFALPHAVTQDVVLDGYVVPKNGSVNFMVAEMGLDPEVWEDPMAFKPERFLGDGETFDLTGIREIKMMPFGAGRRMCPGWALSMLHLEYFVANLVWRFEWKAVDGDDVDLSEVQEFSVVMKNPLKVKLSPRVK